MMSYCESHCAKVALMRETRYCMSYCEILSQLRNVMLQ